jgi:hypothetical protein
MLEKIPPVTGLEYLLEVPAEMMSADELRMYVLFWSNTSFERFFTEARASETIARMQVDATDENSPERHEWTSALDAIIISIRFMEDLQWALTFNLPPPNIEDYANR